MYIYMPGDVTKMLAASLAVTVLWNHGDRIIEAIRRRARELLGKGLGFIVDPCSGESGIGRFNRASWPSECRSDEMPKIEFAGNEFDSRHEATCADSVSTEYGWRWDKPKFIHARRVVDQTLRFKGRHDCIR